MKPQFFFSFLLICCSIGTVLSQDNEEVTTRIWMDSVVVKAQRDGFDVEAFITKVRNDKSFYQAFRNLRYVSYTADNEMHFENKKEKHKADYQSITRQNVMGSCRSMQTLSSNITGDFYKKKEKYRFYTAKMFDEIFFTKDTVCESLARDNINHIDTTKQLKGIQKHVQELKKLIFQPGERVNVPLIGHKTAVFDEDMRKYYQYNLKSEKYANAIDCYVFEVKMAPEYEERKEGKTIIKYMATYFDKSNFQVISRNYDLSYNGALFSFEVHMDIELTQVDGYYVPRQIEYDGFWNVITKRKEMGNFKAKFYDFK
ncbi:MAG: hypothetical protein AAFO07_24760 [Bacteroidota bacterium]